MVEATSIWEFVRRFPDDLSCLNHILDTKFGVDRVCNRCGVANSVWLKSNHKVASCYQCGVVVRPMANTMLHHSRIAPRVWFYAMLLFANMPRGTPAHFLERHLSISHKAAWRLGHSIRRHIACLRIGQARIFSNPSYSVQIDETILKNVVDISGNSSSVLVMGIWSREGIMTFPLRDRSKDSIIENICQLVDRRVNIITDDFASYASLSSRGYQHARITHSKGIWVDGNGNNTCGIDSYWSYLKRYFRTTYKRVSMENVISYLKEAEYRYDCSRKGEDMFLKMISSFPDIR
ncbi:IS1595 family transposase [Novosphingobium marinum]|uniref:ISXO2-like transposase domain-containing protein n=1 Tax=Novosphingobium marinum TaxID=1514948 RepID=A0A7Z0BX41_9SPHN|nr:hypothetical protein [Novosphingobium marinum]